jgi:transglutaminase-like putative cysteine protease
VQLLRSFRLSTYLTLAMACICLGYAEGDLLPESPYITGAVLLSLAVAYRLEGRWSLSLRAANFVGGALILMLVGWIAFQFIRKPTDLVLHLPFPAFILPFLGPVLMILIPAKLFRPKHNGDYWAMHGIGLLAVALGCAMANDMFFGVLLIGYLFCFSWSMSLFYLFREANARNLAALQTARSNRTYLFRVAFRWSLLISVAALLLFLITPRPNDNKWELPMVMRGRAETGLPEGNVDLNRIGTLEQNDELAFSVEAKDAAGIAKLDLDWNQRWRASSLVIYESGKWMRGSEVDRSRTGPFDRLSNKGSEGKRPSPGRLPDYGPRSYSLTFTLARPTAAMTIAASPVLWRPNEPPIHVFGSRASPVVARRDGFFEWVPAPSANRPSYTQMTAVNGEPDLGPPMQLSNGYLEFLTRLPQGTSSDRIRHYTSNLLNRLVQEGSLALEAVQDVDPFTGLPATRRHEAIARALERYLSTSGAFRYTMELDRSDRNLDPVEDFLFNTKAGHCQRFASALALMLRSQGIPAQLVLGYRGCEPQGGGIYFVRQYHAHAWVEAIIHRSPPAQVLPLRPDEAPFAAPEAQHWLSLDPTPGGSPEKDEIDSFSEWLESTLARGQSFFKSFILGYDASARRKTFDSISDRFEEFGEDLAAGEITWPIAIAGGCILLIPATLLARRHWRRGRRDTPEQAAQRKLALITPFHGRLIALLARHGMAPKTGQTAREFAADATKELLRSLPRPEAIVPLQVAEAYYRVRFGDLTATDAELKALDESLNRLADALRFKVPGKTT